MSKLDEINLPIKRTEGETIKERLTENAYKRILPARYLKKNEKGEPIEKQEQLFKRIAKNIALGDVPHLDETITATEKDLRKGLKKEKNPFDKQIQEIEITEDNIYKFSYDTIYPKLSKQSQKQIDQTVKKFTEIMEHLKFTPNCVAPTTTVGTPTGTKQITDIEKGENVSDDHGQAEVAETFDNGTKQMQTITTSDGYQVTSSKEHVFRIINEKGEYVWKQASKISPGDWMALQSNYISEDNSVSLDTDINYHGNAKKIDLPEKINSSLAQWLGLLIADGSVEDTRVRVAFDKKDPDLKEVFDELTKTIFGYEPKTREFDDKNCTVSVIPIRAVVKFLRQNGLSKKSSISARIPDKIQKSGRNCISAFLSGLFEGDGSVETRAIAYYTKSSELASQVQTLLLGLGIESKKSKKRGGYRITIRKNEYGRRFTEKIGFISSRKNKSLKRFKETTKASTKIPNQQSKLKEWYHSRDDLGHDFYKKISQFIIDSSSPYSQDISVEAFKRIAETYPELWESPIADLVELDQIYKKVESIENAGYLDACDLNVPNRNTFVADGFVSHNSPTIMNAGDELQQLSACFVDSPEDDMGDIHQTVKEASKIFQSGGGVGYAFWRLRPYGDIVKSTGGIASGPITFMRTFDQLCETVAQGGTRRGAQMGIMKIDHPDIPFFIHAKNKDVSLAYSLRLNDPDDPTHTSFGDALQEARQLIDGDGKIPKHLRNAAEGHLSNFNISVGVTDEFMEAVENNEDYTLYNPRTEKPHIATEETKQLYSWFDLEQHVEIGEALKIPAKEIWDRIAQGAWENGEPGVFYIDQTNKKHSFDTQKHPSHQMLATNPCVTGDTLIHTGNGLVPAEELYEHGVACDVVVDGRLSEDDVKEASSVYKTGEKDVYKLRTSEGYELRLTADHRVMTDDGWVEAQNLELGQTVHIRNQKGGFGQHGSAEEGRVLGWLVGDGHLKDGEKRAVLNFYDEDAEISEQFASDVNNVVREPISSEEYEIGVNKVSWNDDYRGTQVVEKRIRSTRLYEYAEQAGLVDEKLQVPDVIMRGSEEMARGFLQALFSTDGSVQGTVEKGVSVTLASVDADLLKEVQQLLLNFGIASKVYEDRKQSGVTELPDGHRNMKEYETQSLHELVIVKDNLIRFSQEIGFLLNSKTDKLEELFDEYDRRSYTERFKVTVESFERDGYEAVYDLTEPGTNSFVANGLVVHNCGEQPLEEYEACNLGHINLSTIVDRDRQLWDNFEFSVKDNNLEDRVEEFLGQAIDWDEFDYRIDASTHFLDNVVTMSDFPIEKIEDTVSSMRKIGLGIMGLAQLYIQVGVKYGGDEANEIARQLMQYINYRSKEKSRELAGSRGSFSMWEDSKYADPTNYPEWFKQHVGEDPSDWDDGYPIRNHNVTTIAPTGCVEENSLVSTDEGLRPIKNLDETTAEFEMWDEIEVGVSTDGGTKTANAVYDNGFDTVKTITTETGFSIAATPDHKFRVLTEENEYRWRKVRDINSGDSIVLKRGSYIDRGEASYLDISERENIHFRSDQNLQLPERMSPELAVLLGFYIGDGHLNTTNGVELAVDTEYPETIKRLIDLGEHVFGVTVTTEEKANCVIVSIGGKHVTRFFEDNGWKKSSRTAFIPDQVLDSGKEVTRAFLRGLFEADGTASRKIELSTTSEILAKQVQTVLLSLGIVFKRDKKPLTSYDSRNNSTEESSSIFNLRGLNKAQDKKFLDEIGFINKSTDIELKESSYRKDKYPPSVVDAVRETEGYYENCDRSIKDKVNDAKRRSGLTYNLLQTIEEKTEEPVTIGGRRLSTLFVDTVESIDDGVAYTKDISVPSNNTYIANGFVSHNTTSMIGNTTGGCEPMYNVAYFKNVTQDVQGEDMLVEFDDYFLRVLEVNDIDVEEVKSEAQDKMDRGEFDGVDDLDSVPDEIKDLFVVAGDLSGKEHAKVQGALQEGVDSAISKTCNFPSDASVEDIKEVYRYIYDNGGKGVTVYRDGSRSKQVLTTGSGSDVVDEESVVEKMKQLIDQGELDLEDFLEELDVDMANGEKTQQDIDLEQKYNIDTESGVESGSGSGGDVGSSGIATPEDRPLSLSGETYKVKAPASELEGNTNVYVTINDKLGSPFEVFISVGKSGSFLESYTEAIGRLISLYLRSGGSAQEVVDQLKGIRSPEIAYDKIVTESDKESQKRVFSVPDAIAKAIDYNIKTGGTKQVNLQSIPDEKSKKDEKIQTEETDERIGESEDGDTSIDEDVDRDDLNPRCPECGAKLVMSEGCMKCPDGCVSKC